MVNQQDQDNVKQLFSYLGIDEQRVTLEEENDLIKITVDVPPEEAGIYIGRFASVLDSCQLVLSLMLNRGEDRKHILLDIGGYRERRLSVLEEMVERVTHEVEDSGMAVALPPLSSTERRQVHLMFKDHETLTTYSEGEGIARRIYISPKTV